MVTASTRTLERQAQPAIADAAGDLPLCVDLDGTLCRSDTLIDSLIIGLRSLRVLRAVIVLFTHGLAAMKQEIAKAIPIDATTLPYNSDVIHYLESEKARGRRLVLATASDQRTAHAVNAHLGLFDEVLASDGACNLKGSRKAAALVERFGEKGFVYAGNDHSDVAVWERAGSAIVVNASRSVRSKVASPISIGERADRRRSAAIPLLRALRPHQWAKNLLVFVPIATSHSLRDAGSWSSAGWAFAAFCAAASSIYIVNDLLDLGADRLHPRKRLRPFASGLVSPIAGLAISLMLFAAGLLFAAQTGVVPIVLAYAAVSLSYSLWLKEFPLVDIFVLAGLYTLRLFAGGQASGHFVSLWLLGFSSFFFLSLALVKRVSELTSLSKGNAARRGYGPSDLNVLQLMGIASGFTSAVILSLFVQDETTTQVYASPQLLWCTVPLILFWLCRIWLSTARGYMHDDPIVYAAKDWVSWIVVAAVFSTLAAAKTVAIGS